MNNIQSNSIVLDFAETSGLIQVIEKVILPAGIYLSSEDLKNLSRTCKRIKEVIELYNQQLYDASQITCTKILNDKRIIIVSKDVQVQLLYYNIFINTFSLKYDRFLTLDLDNKPNNKYEFECDVQTQIKKLNLRIDTLKRDDVYIEEQFLLYKNNGSLELDELKNYFDKQLKSVIDSYTWYDNTHLLCTAGQALLEIEYKKYSYLYSSEYIQIQEFFFSMLYQYLPAHIWNEDDVNLDFALFYDDIQDLVYKFIKMYFLKGKNKIKLNQQGLNKKELQDDNKAIENFLKIGFFLTDLAILREDEIDILLICLDRINFKNYDWKNFKSFFNDSRKLINIQKLYGNELNFEEILTRFLDVMYHNRTINDELKLFNNLSNEERENLREQLKYSNRKINNAIDTGNVEDLKSLLITISNLVETTSETQGKAVIQRSLAVNLYRAFKNLNILNKSILIWQWKQMLQEGLTDYGVGQQLNFVNQRLILSNEDRKKVLLMKTIIEELLRLQPCIESSLLIFVKMLDIDPILKSMIKLFFIQHLRTSMKEDRELRKAIEEHTDTQATIDEIIEDHRKLFTHLDVKQLEDIYADAVKQMQTELADNKRKQVEEDGQEDKLTRKQKRQKVNV